MKIIVPERAICMKKDDGKKYITAYLSHHLLNAKIRSVFIENCSGLYIIHVLYFVGVHRELTQEEELTHTHTRRKNSGHRGFCVAYSLQPFLIISLAIYSITEEWQVEILPMRHDPNYLLAPSHEHRNDSGHKLAHDPL
jgi:hypothetical protein